MRSPALALAGLVWLRYCRQLTACAAVWLALAAVAQLVPVGLWAAGPADGPVLPAHFVFFVLSLVPVFAVVACAFSYVFDAQLDARESAYPARSFALPVATPALVFWPMFQGAAVGAGVWVAWAVALL